MLRILYRIKREKVSKGALCLPKWNSSCSSSHTFTILHRKYLSAFKKIVSVPVELVSSAATTISSPFQNRGTHSPDISVSSSAPTTPTETPSTPVIPDTKEANRLSVSSTPITSEEGEKKKTAVENVRKRSSSHTGSRPSSMSSVRSDNELNNAMQELDALQHLLSLELCLQLIHINKDAEHRVQRFVKVGFPGRLRTEV